MVAPISAPILQIVAIPREVGEETTGSNQKVQGHSILQKSVYAKDSKARRNQGISHRNLKPQLRGHWQYNGWVSPLCFWSIQWLWPDSCGRNEPKVTLIHADTDITRTAACTEHQIIYSSEQYLCYLQWVSCSSLPSCLFSLEEPDICEKFNGLNKMLPVKEHSTSLSRTQQWRCRSSCFTFNKLEADIKFLWFHRRKIPNCSPFVNQVF